MRTNTVAITPKKYLAENPACKDHQLDDIIAILDVEETPYVIMCADPDVFVLSVSLIDTRDGEVVDEYDTVEEALRFFTFRA